MLFPLYIIHLITMVFFAKYHNKPFNKPDRCSCEHLQTIISFFSFLQAFQPMYRTHFQVDSNFTKSFAVGFELICTFATKTHRTHLLCEWYDGTFPWCLYLHNCFSTQVWQSTFRLLEIVPEDNSDMWKFKIFFSISWLIFMDLFFFSMMSQKKCIHSSSFLLK